MFPPVGYVRFFGHVLADAVKTIRISIESMDKICDFQTICLLFMAKLFEWKSEAEVQSMREVKDTEMLSQAETSSPPQQTLAWRDISQQQAQPYLVPWGPQQDKSMLPLKEGTKVLALLIAAQLHCLHTLLFILGSETEETQ